MKVFTSFNLLFALCFAFIQSIVPELSAGRKPAGHEWHILEQGNVEYVDSAKFAKQRAKVANGQNPRTIVLGCSDSRVTPEFIFNSEIGDLFVGRVAGNVADPVVIDSFEFAVGRWDVDTIVVLGHSHCGAVEGALGRLRKNGGKLDPLGPGVLNAVLVPIEKAIIAGRVNIFAKDALEKSIIANIAYQADQLRLNSPVIAAALKKGRIKIFGAEYDLKTGKVTKIFTFDKHSFN